MFLEHLLTYEDRQKLLKLYGWNLIELCPKYMETSKMVCRVRFTRTRYGQSEQAQEFYLPRIKPTTVYRLMRMLKAGQRGVVSEQIATLFYLGLGVPKQPDIARYILALDSVDNPKVGIKYILKLVRNYVSNYRKSLDNHPYMFCAQYTEQLMKLKRFIAPPDMKMSKHLKVPKGFPAVMVYSVTDLTKSMHTLVDGFVITASGAALPISPAVLRKEFIAAPKNFSSYSLRSHGQYTLVFGILYWPDTNEESFEEMQTLDVDDFITLVDLYDDKYSNDELRKAQAARNVDPETHLNFRRTLETLRTEKDLDKKKRRKLKEAETYFAERDLSLKSLDGLEKKAARHVAKVGPIATASFLALDIGSLGKTRTVRSLVSTKPEALAKSLGIFGFQTLNTVNANCLTSRISYGVKSNRRSWLMKTEK